MFSSKTRPKVGSIKYPTTVREEPEILPQGEPSESGRNQAWAQSQFITERLIILFFFFQIIKNRQVATVSVFILSAIVHEYVLLFAFRFFYPILLILFGAFGCKYIGFVFISFECILVICFHCDIHDDYSVSSGDGVARVVGKGKNARLDRGKRVSLPFRVSVACLVLSGAYITFKRLLRLLVMVVLLVMVMTVVMKILIEPLYYF